MSRKQFPLARKTASIEIERPKTLAFLSQAGFAAGTAGGGNVTGLSTMSDQLTLTHLELLKEALPGITRVAVL